MQATTQQPTPGPTITMTPSGPVISVNRSAEPSQVLEAFRQQRSELRNQLQRLESQRRDLAQELQRPNLDDAAQKGLEARLAAVDTRIAALDKSIAEADASVARAAAVPGAIIPPPPEPRRNGPDPDDVFAFLAFLTIVIAFPLTIAYARRIWRKGAQTVAAAIPQEIYDRFNRVDQAIDSVAVEVERIGEGQRYITRLYAEQQRALGAGAAEPVRASEREADELRR
jgi:hypothetical protein